MHGGKRVSMNVACNAPHGKVLGPLLLYLYTAVMFPIAAKQIVFWSSPLVLSIEVFLALPHGKLHTFLSISHVTAIYFVPYDVIFLEPN